MHKVITIYPVVLKRYYRCNIAYWCCRLCQKISRLNVKYKQEKLSSDELSNKLNYWISNNR